MAKPYERIIRDSSGPATVSRERIREAAKQIWDDKRRMHSSGAKTGNGRSHASGQKKGSRTGRFDNAPTLKPNRAA